MTMERPLAEVIRTSRSRLARSSHLWRAATVAGAVGTALVVLNQGDLLLDWLHGDASLPHALAWKIPLTYSVPFLVSWGSSAAACPDDR
jgi:hypothetical protein